MKKRRLGMAALALLAGGLGQMTPTALNAKTVEITQQAKQELPKQTRETRRQILPDGFGGLDFPPVDHGRSPKEYGQWLQYNRKQKWSK